MIEKMKHISATHPPEGRRVDMVEGASNRTASRTDESDVVRRKSQELPRLRVDREKDDDTSSSSKNDTMDRAAAGHDYNASWKRKSIVSPEVMPAGVRTGGGGGRLSHHSWAKRIYSKMKEFQSMFGLGEDEELLDSFMCALRKRILLQGRMYVFTGHVCFSSSLFGYHKVKSIPIHSILSLRKMKNVGFPNSVEIVWKDGNSVKKEFFTSFLSREEAFKLILSLWEGSMCTNVFTVKQDDGETKREGDRSSEESSSNMSGDMSSPVGGHDKANEPLKMLEDHIMMLEMKNVEKEDKKPFGEILTPREGGDTALSMHPFAATLSAQPPPPVSPVMQKVMEYSLPVHPKEFYDTFLSSKSDFFVEFHAAQGHKDIKLTPWDDHSSIGPVRDLSFVTALKGFRIGPSEALCHQTHRVGVYQGSHTVFETSQVMSDIPYGDHFKVETRWDIYPDKKGTGSTLVIHIAVPFTKNTMWKKFIEKGVTESLLEAYQMFRKLADQTLARLGDLDDSRSLKPEDLLPQQEEDWDMILERIEPKFRGGLASLRKMQQDVAHQNKFSLSKPQHRRNMSIIDSDILDAIIPPEEEKQDVQETEPIHDEKKGSTMHRSCPSCLQPLDSHNRMRLLFSFVIALLAVILVQFLFVWRVYTAKT